MIPAFGAAFVLIGLAVIFAPAQTGAAIRRLNRLGRAPDYWYHDPARIRSSHKLAAAYRLSGLFLALAGVYLLRGPRIAGSREADARDSVGWLFGLLAPGYVLWNGFKFLLDPAWFETKWGAKPPDLSDRLFRFRLKGYRVMGALFILIALYMWWTFATR